MGPAATRAGGSASCWPAARLHAQATRRLRRAERTLRSGVIVTANLLQRRASRQYWPVARGAGSLLHEPAVAHDQRLAGQGVGREGGEEEHRLRRRRRWW